MFRRVVVSLSVVIALISFSATVHGREKDELKIGDPAPRFTLKDADDKEYDLKLLIDSDDVKVIVLIMGDRKARKTGNKWAIELDKVYGKCKEVVMLMVADLRGLPFYVTEGMVKWGTKREKLPVPILLDWEGKVNKMYKTKKGKPDLFIIDGDGKILYHCVDKCSSGLLEKVKAEINGGLKKKVIRNRSG